MSEKLHNEENLAFCVSKMISLNFLELSHQQWSFKYYFPFKKKSIKSKASSLWWWSKHLNENHLAIFYPLSRKCSFLWIRFSQLLYDRRGKCSLRRRQIKMFSILLQVIFFVRSLCVETWEILIEFISSRISHFAKCTKI